MAASASALSGPTDLFISYPWGAVDAATGTRPLQERVLAIVALLRAAGFTVWLDLERMASGATGGAGGTPDAMSSGVRGASAVVCFVAEEYARSKNCRLEAEYARRRVKPMFYVNIGAPGWLPESFAEKDAEAVSWLEVLIMNDFLFDARAKESAAAQIAQLVRALKANAKVSCSGSGSGAGGGSGMGGGGAGGSGAGGAAAEAELGEALQRAQLEAMRFRDEAGVTAVREEAAMMRPVLPAAEAHAKGEQLLEACKDESAGDALRLVKEGADVNVAGKDGRTPLIIAGGKGLGSVVARLLLAGASLDLVDKDGASALMRASSEGHTAVAQLLADERAKLDLVDKDGSSALMWASFCGYAAIAQLLAARMDAAALNLIAKDGKTALDKASEGGWRKKVADLAPVAATIRARGGLSGAEL